MGHWTDKYVPYDPCAEALADARRYSTPQGWWDACIDGSWMEWVLDVVGWPDGVELKYASVTEPELKKYRHVVAQAMLADSTRDTLGPSAEYKRAQKAAWTEYFYTKAEEIRRLIPIAPNGEMLGERYLPSEDFDD